MIRLIWCCCLLLYITATFCQAEDQALPAAMQGTWFVESLTDSGGAINVLEGDKFEFAKGKLRVHEPREETTIEFSVKLGGTEPPKLIDISTGEHSAQGIYELRDGKLIICFAQPGKARPTEFRSRKRDNRRLYILTRSRE